MSLRRASDSFDAFACSFLRIFSLVSCRSSSRICASSAFSFSLDSGFAPFVFISFTSPCFSRFSPGGASWARHGVRGLGCDFRLGGVSLRRASKGTQGCVVGELGPTDDGAPAESADSLLRIVPCRPAAKSASSSMDMSLFNGRRCASDFEMSSVSLMESGAASLTERFSGAKTPCSALPTRSRSSSGSASTCGMNSSRPSALRPNLLPIPSRLAFSFGGEDTTSSPSCEVSLSESSSSDMSAFPLSTPHCRVGAMRCPSESWCAYAQVCCIGGDGFEA
mmetsp:Transcript_1829/g.4133  ORF Transcript_1829/g.4133 Transcript_1829/m.4133 type:complete len:279 (-) Transcript_1829:87-923(-)